MVFVVVMSASPVVSGALTILWAGPYWRDGEWIIKIRGESTPNWMTWARIRAMGIGITFTVGFGVLLLYAIVRLAS